MKQCFSINFTISSILLLFLSMTLSAQGRYNLPRDYVEDVSAVTAYRLTQFKSFKNFRPGFQRPVIIDVRDVEEYALSHAKNAWSIPFPHIYKRSDSTEYIAQDPKTFYEAVAALFPKNKPIFIICRSGYRSNLAANILANPTVWVPEYANSDIKGFTQVKNVWEGMEGVFRIAVEAQHEVIPIIDDPNTGTALVLDVNNDGILNLADKDGWLGHLNLPYSTRLRPYLLYQPYLHLYYQ
ncbi:MAG: rhodanese-like domain-containing protein [Pseudomonadota bacterium]